MVQGQTLLREQASFTPAFWNNSFAAIFFGNTVNDWYETRSI